MVSEAQIVNQVQVRQAAKRLLAVWGGSLDRRAVMVAVMLAPDTCRLSEYYRQKLTDRIWRRAKRIKEAKPHKKGV